MGRRPEPLENVDSLKAERAKLYKDLKLPRSISGLENRKKKLEGEIVALEASLEASKSKCRSEAIEAKKAASEGLIGTLQSLKEGILQLRGEEKSLQEQLTLLSKNRISFQKEIKEIQEKIFIEKTEYKAYIELQNNTLATEWEKAKEFEQELFEKEISLNKEKDEIHNSGNVLAAAKRLYDDNLDVGTDKLTKKRQTLKNMEDKLIKDEKDFLTRVKRQEVAFLEVERTIKDDRQIVSSQLKELRDRDRELSKREGDVKIREEELKLNWEVYRDIKVRLESEKRKVLSQQRNERWEDG